MALERKIDRLALEKVAKVFSAFSDATRLAVLMELKGRALTVSELVSRVGVSQGNVSKHLHLLYEAGLLDRQKEGNKVFYSIDDEMIFPLCKMVCNKLNNDAKASSELMYHI